jgi:hypothetical protein
MTAMLVAASDVILPACGDALAHRQPHPWPAPSSRVLRGGSWNNNPQNLRSANRNRNNPTNRNNNNGFRLASTPSDRLRRSASPKGAMSGKPDIAARVAAFTDAAREQRVRPEPAMLSGRLSGSGAVMRRRRLAGHMGRDGGVVHALTAS